MHSFMCHINERYGFRLADYQAFKRLGQALKREKDMNPLQDVIVEEAPSIESSDEEVILGAQFIALMKRECHPSTRQDNLHRCLNFLHRIACDD